MHFDFNPINPRFILLSVRFSLSIYNTVLVLDGFISQPTFSRVIPQQNKELARLDVVVCKNIYAELMASGYIDHRKVQELRILAVQTRNFDPFLRQSTNMLLNISLPDSVLDQYANVLQIIGQYFLNCSAMLGQCSTLFAGYGFSDSYDCCDHARQVTSENEICFRLSNNQMQNASGKNYAALYELRYGAYSHDKQYTLQLVDKDQIANTYQFPVAIIKAGTTMDISVQKQVSVRINFTENCTTDPRLAEPLCSSLVVTKLVNEECHCDVGMPLANNVSSSSNHIRQACRPFEKWKCWSEVNNRLSKNLDERKTKKMFEEMKKCYPLACETTSFVTQINAKRLPKYFDAYMDGAEEGTNHVKTSTLYVYYSSLTVVYDHEARTQTWLTVVSSLGGVWSLWLGWSLYDAANRLLLLVSNIGIKYKTVRSMKKLDMDDKSVSTKQVSDQ